MTPTHRVALLGDTEVGKSSFIHKNLTGEFISEYTPTTACHITTLPFITIAQSHGLVNLEVLEIPGAELTSPSEAERLKDMDAAIILFDLSRREKFDNVTHWHNEIFSANKNPVCIIICGTKGDIPVEERDLTLDEIKLSTTLRNLEYFELSMRDLSADFELPFLSILRQIYNDPELHFVPARCCFPHPGQTIIHPEELARWTQEMKDAEAMSLPSGDESDL